MLLQSLVEYSRRPSFNLPPALYSELPVRYIIELDADGHYLGMVDTADNATARTKRGQLRLIPEIRRTSGPKALLLCDKADYVLGYGGADVRHGLFKDLVSRCAASSEEPALNAVLKFLHELEFDELDLPPDFAPADRLTFRVAGVFPTDLPAVQAFWAAENDPLQRGAPVMNCLVCGAERPVMRTMKAIKGIPGGQTSGTSIISANAEAFESYGLEQSYTAPTCSDCAERFTQAANDLLGNRESRTVLAGSAFVYWTREDVGFDFVGLFTDPQPEEVGLLLDSLRSGQAPPDVDETRFYAAAFSASGGRAVVRDWIDTTVAEAKRHLATWFGRQRIVDPYGESHRPLGLAALAGATVRELRDVSPPLSRALVAAALSGKPLPLDLMYQAVRRNHAEQDVTRPRAALIKLVLSSQPEHKEWEETMVTLDLEQDNAAYRCGRLLAVLEEAQRRAIPGVSATIIDRYFATASSAPASVFPRLLRGVQPHIAKLERDNRGAAIALNRRIEDIVAGLGLARVGAVYTGFPVLLTLQDQGLFALGYYHQRGHDRAAAAEAGRARRETQPAGAAEPNEPGGEPSSKEENQ